MSMKKFRLKQVFVLAGTVVWYSYRKEREIFTFKIRLHFRLVFYFDRFNRNFKFRFRKLQLFSISLSGFFATFDLTTLIHIYLCTGYTNTEKSKWNKIKTELFFSKIFFPFLNSQYSGICKKPVLFDWLLVSVFAG